MHVIDTNPVLVLQEPLRTRLRAALSRHKTTVGRFATMFGISKIFASNMLNAKKEIPAKYWALMERWIATGVAPEKEDVERLRVPASNGGYRTITTQELEKVGLVCTTVAEAAAYFGYRTVTFCGLIDDNRDFREAFNKQAKDRMPIIEIENMAEIGCNLEDIAKVKSLRKDQVERVFQTWGEYEQAYERGIAKQKVSVRHRQMEILMDKTKPHQSAIMAMYLGKVILGQNDRPETKKEDPKKAALTVVRWATEDEASDFKQGNFNGSVTAELNSLQVVSGDE